MIYIFIPVAKDCDLFNLKRQKCNFTYKALTVFIHISSLQNQRFAVFQSPTHKCCGVNKV